MDCYKLTESQQRQAKWMHDFLKDMSYRCSGSPRPYLRCDFCGGVMVLQSDWAAHCDSDWTYINLSRHTDKMASNQTAMDALINEMVTDVEYHERYKALKTLIDQARRRQDIPEYKRLYKELTGQDIEIYTVPTKDRLIPRDHDKNKDAEFWFE